MYSVPYSHDFHSNWLGIWIHREADMDGDDSVFDRMYYGDAFKDFRQEYYYELPTLVYRDADFTVRASMGSSHKTSIAISFENNTTNRPNRNGK